MDRDLKQYINRVPPGLLSLLDIKSMGQNPVGLAEDLRAQLDVTSLYVGAVATARQGQTNAFGVPGLFPTATGFSFVAQPGEILILERCVLVAAAVLGAGQSYRVRLAVSDSAGVMTYVSPAASGGPGERPATSAERVLILQPGSQLQLWIESSVAGATAFLISANVASLRS